MDYYLYSLRYFFYALRITDYELYVYFSLSLKAKISAKAKILLPEVLIIPNTIIANTFTMKIDVKVKRCCGTIAS